jgi:hypothetical protein
LPYLTIYPLNKNFDVVRIPFFLAFLYYYWNNLTSNEIYEKIGI